MSDDEQRYFVPDFVREFTRHLEEEGLASTDPLDEYDVWAINGNDEALAIALARIAEIVRQASSEIEARRRPIPHFKKKRPSPPDFYRHVERGYSWPEDSYFEWNGRSDHARFVRTGAWVLGAGVSWNKDHEPSERDLPEWFARRYEQGFEFGMAQKHVFHLFRYVTLDELAGHRTLAEQAKLVAALALESWAFLDADPPFMT